MPREDRDSPWKDLLEYDFERFLAFFRPNIHRRLDWTRDPVALEQEQRPLRPESPRGRRVADKIIGLRNLRGDLRYFHIEIQSRREKYFARRVHVYNSRAEDKLDAPVVSMVILLDDDAAWRPTEYVSRQYGCRRTLTFLTTKLIDYRADEAGLRSHENPVALFALAALAQKRFGRETPEREAAKIDLIRLLKERRMEAAEEWRWRRYLDWLLRLPPEAERRVLETTKETEGQMPYVPSWERIARKEAKVEGKVEGILLTLPALLRVRFGEEGAAFAREIDGLPADTLARLAAEAETATLEELRRLA